MTATSDPTERLRRLRALFDIAIDLPADERRAWLARQSDDDGLRRELSAMLETAESTDDGLAGRDVASEFFAAPPDDDALVGQRLGAYHVRRLVGRGGMGAVYEAVRDDDQYRKRVAIKVVRPGIMSDLSFARFRRERQILANLAHPGIAMLLDGGVTPDGSPFLVMEYVEGDPITTWCDDRRLSLRERLVLFRQVCDAVRHAHKNLVIHRDIKPGNILVTRDGAVKLLDFGIAKLLGDDEADAEMPLTRGDARAFTLEYASPEQVRGDALTTSCDVYSLGAVLYELLAGRRPHVADTRAALERAVLGESPPAPSAVVTADAATRRGERSAERLRRRLRGELDLIALTALRGEPARRYASVEALDEDVRRHLTGQPVAARRDSAWYRAWKFARRNAAVVTASVLVVLALVAGVVTTTIEARRARAQQLRSERVSGFLRELLASVRPVTGGRDVPVSEVLDAAARRVATELPDQPAVRAELEGVIGQSYQSLGRYDESAAHLEQALALQRQLGGASSLGALAALDNVGGVALARGELDRADSLFQHALALERSRSAAPDTLTATILDNMGSVAHDRGNDTTGERYHREALAIRRKLLPPSDDRIAISLNNVAVSLGEQNRWAESEPMLREAIRILRANHPGPHQLVADALNTLASTLDLQGKNVAAESTYVAVIAMRRQLLGAEHPDYAFTVFNYAMFSYDRGEYERAMQLSREVLALRGRTLPESHPAIAASLQTVGRCLDKLGDTDGGERALQESLALRRKYLPADSWLIASSESMLGEHYTLLGQYARAEPLLLRADSVLTATFGTGNLRTQSNLKRVVAMYEAWSRPRRAAPFRARVLAPD